MTNKSFFQQLHEATRNEQIDVSTSSKMISEARNELNPRDVITIRNTSAAEADIITVNMGFNQATANNGIVLKMGESFTDTGETGYKAYQGGITAICATVNGKLSIFER